MKRKLKKNYIIIKKELYRAKNRGSREYQKQPRQELPASEILIYNASGLPYSWGGLWGGLGGARQVSPWFKGFISRDTSQPTSQVSNKYLTSISQVSNKYKYPTSIQQVSNEYPTSTQQASNKYPISCHLPTFYYSEFSSQRECLHILPKTSRQIPTRIKKELCRDKNRDPREYKDVHFPRFLFLMILVFQSLKEIVEGIF